MKRCGEIVPNIEFVSNRKGTRHWLVDSKKKRVTPKFKLKAINSVDNFVHLKTSIGNIVYHSMKSDILYVSDIDAEEIKLGKISERLYEILIKYKSSCQTCSKLYSQYGGFIREFTYVSKLVNGLIATKQGDRWGFIAEDANNVVPYIYVEVSSFNEHGYAVVDLNKKWLHEKSLKTIIDKTGKQLFEPIECWSLEFVTKEQIRVDMGGRYGIIDLTGKEIIPAIYSNIIVTSDFYQVEYKGNWGMFDKAGILLLETIYDEIIETPNKFVVRDFAKIEIAKTKEISKK